MPSTASTGRTASSARGCGSSAHRPSTDDRPRSSVAAARRGSRAVTVPVSSQPPRRRRRSPTCEWPDGDDAARRRAAPGVARSWSRNGSASFSRSGIASRSGHAAAVHADGAPVGSRGPARPATVSAGIAARSGRPRRRRRSRPRSPVRRRWGDEQVPTSAACGRVARTAREGRRSAPPGRTPRRGAAGRCPGRPTRRRGRCSPARSGDEAAARGASTPAMRATAIRLTSSGRASSRRSATCGGSRSAARGRRMAVRSG